MSPLVTFYLVISLWAAGGFDTHFTLQSTLSEGAAKQKRLHLRWKTLDSIFLSKTKIKLTIA